MMCGFTSIEYVMEVWVWMARHGLMVIRLMKVHFPILFFSVCLIYST